MSRGLVWLMVAGCGARSSAPAEPPDEERPPKETRCYEGEETNDDRFGGPFSARVLLRRSVIPEFAKIREEWLGPQGWVLDIAIDLETSELEVVDLADKQFEPGAGELEGERWRWDRWTWHTPASEPRLGAEYERTESGIHGAYSINSFEGLITYAQELAEFDCAEWDTRAAP